MQLDTIPQKCHDAEIVYVQFDHDDKFGH